MENDIPVFKGSLSQILRTDLGLNPSLGSEKSVPNHLGCDLLSVATSLDQLTFIIQI